MKDRIKKFILKVLKLKLYQKILIIALAVMIIYVSYNLNYWITSNKYIATDYSVYQLAKKDLTQGTEIPISSTEEVKICDNNRYELGIIPATTNIYIKDKDTNSKWYSIVTDVEGMYGEEPNYSQSNILLEFENVANKNTGTLSSYQYSVAMQEYKIEKFINGLRITYNISQSVITIAYFPEKLSIERMDELILNNENLSDADKNFVVRAIYELNSAQNYYARKANASLNNRKKMYEILYENVGYTNEDLIRDNSEYGVETTVASIPSFTVALEVFLEANSIKVNVPTYAFEESLEYRIKNINVLPYFGAAKSSDEGYIFIPDGSGALMNYNNYTNAGLYYKKQVYDNDAMLNTGFAYHHSHSEEIKMPVFGSINQTQNKGVMCIVQNGGEMSKIIASSSGYMNNLYNLTYTQMQYYVEDTIGLYNTYDPNTVKVVTDSPLYFDYELIYYFLEGEENSYFAMAKLYQDYLINYYNLERNYDEKPKMVIEALGAFTVTNKLYGIPYEKQTPLTTISDLESIATELYNAGIDNVSFIYNAWCNGGINQTSLAKIEMLSSVGKQKDIQELNEKIEGLDYSISYALNVIKVYKNRTNGFNKNQYAARTMDNDAFEFFKYSPTTHEFDTNTSAHYFISPKYIQAMINSINKYTEKYGLSSLTFNDIGSIFISDYNRSNFIDGLVSRALVEDGLSKTNSDLILRDPYDYAYNYSSYLLDVAYESSNLYCFSASIPFKQLVLNGLINYSTVDLNNNTIDFSKTSYLKAIETGSDLKYLITNQNTSKLKSTEYNYIYSSNYDYWKDEIIDYSNKYQEDYQRIGSRIIVNHEILSENVYKVTYDSGAVIVFNYSFKEYFYEGIKVACNSMEIFQGEV